MQHKYDINILSRMTIHLVELQWYLEGIFVRLCLLCPKEHVNKW